MKSLFDNLAARLRECRGVLVDSNVLIDVSNANPEWGEWSSNALIQVAEHSDLIINPIIYAEVSVGFSTVEKLNAKIPPAAYIREPLPWEGGFLAGKCYLAYRRRGGSKTTPLPDFYIGAHAAVERLALLTRDDSIYRIYFPTIEILSPASSRRAN